MVAIDVRYERSDSFSVRIGHHHLLVDQPHDVGGEDRGPTPTELFVASLAACVGFYAERFMRRHDIRPEGLAVACDFAMSDERPARVSEIDIEMTLPVGFPPARLPALLRVVEHCTVHNSITRAPSIQIGVAANEGAA